LEDIKKGLFDLNKTTSQLETRLGNKTSDQFEEIETTLKKYTPKQIDAFFRRERFRQFKYDEFENELRQVCARIQSNYAFLLSRTYPKSTSPQPPIFQSFDVYKKVVEFESERMTIMAPASIVDICN
jgi:hypothetical protein